MPAPISVSPRGGPQPARRQSIARSMGPAQVIGGGSQVPEYFGDGSLTDAIVRATANVARRAGQPSRRPPAPLSMDTPTRSEVGPPAGFVPPTAADLSAFMEDLYAGAAEGTITRDQFSALLGPVYNRVNQDGQAKSLDSVIMAAVGGATGPEGLASMLGRSVEDIQGPLLDPVANRAATDAAIDASIAQAENRATAPPTRPGGQTADSIDREGADPDGDGMVDPLTYASEVPLGSADLEAMILALQNRRLDEAPARLAEAKRLIMERTAADIARANELGAAYRAGLGQSSIQGPLPGAGESTAQSQYTTAAPVRAAASPLNGFLPGIDTVAAEDEILQTAYLIEQDRKTAAEEAMLASLEEQFKVRAAEEAELESIVKGEEKKATKATLDQERRNLTAEATRVWAQSRAEDVIAAYGRQKSFLRDGAAVDGYDVSPPESAEKALSALVARFRGSDSPEQAVKAVFGSDVRTSDLNVVALNLIQVAKVLAGREIPKEMYGISAGKGGMTLDEFISTALATEGG